MDTKFKIAQEHEIAVFLFPKFKSLKMFSETDKARIIGNIELKLLRIDLEEDNRHTDLQEVNNIQQEILIIQETPLFLNGKMTRMIQTNQEIILGTKKRLKIIKTNTLKFNTITFWNFGRIKNTFFHFCLFWRSKFWPFRQAVQAVNGHLALPEG